MQHSKLFATSLFLEIIAMDIPYPLPKTTNCNQIMVIMADQFSKVTRAVPALKTSTRHIVSISYKHFIVLYGIPGYIVVDNGKHFGGKFL